jgi:hypothetical protein
MSKLELQEQQVEAFAPCTSIEKLPKSSWFIQTKKKKKLN